MLSNKPNDGAAQRVRDETPEEPQHFPPTISELLLHADDQVFRALFDAVNDGIFISDPRTGRFVEVNEPACRMFGYEKAQLQLLQSFSCPDVQGFYLSPPLSIRRSNHAVPACGEGFHDHEGRRIRRMIRAPDSPKAQADPPVH